MKFAGKLTYFYLLLFRSLSVTKAPDKENPDFSARFGFFFLGRKDLQTNVIVLGTFYVNYLEILATY